MNKTNLINTLSDLDSNQVQAGLQLLSSMYLLANVDPKNAMELLTTKEVTDRLGLSYPTFVQLLETVPLPRIKVGKTIRYPWLKVIETLSNYADDFYNQLSLQELVSAG